MTSSPGAGDETSAAGPAGPSPPGALTSSTRLSWSSIGRRLLQRISAARRTILFVGASLVVVVGLFFLFGLMGFYNLKFIWEYLPSGFGPLELSLEYTTITYLLGMGPAMAMALIRAFPPRRTPPPPPRSLDHAPPPKRRRQWGLIWRYPAYGFSSGFVAAIRGTPFLVQLLIVYYVIIFTTPSLTFLGWDAPYLAGFFALLLSTTAYQTETFRGGFQSIDRSQIEAGRAMGLTRLQIFLRITLPQGMRLVTLPLTNEWISNFKTATILSTIGIVEVFYWSQNYISFTLSRPIEGFVMLCIFYLIINVTLSRVVTYIEAARRIPGLGSLPPEGEDLRRIVGAGRPRVEMALPSTANPKPGASPVGVNRALHSLAPTVATSGSLRSDEVA